MKSSNLIITKMKEIVNLYDYYFSSFINRDEFFIASRYEDSLEKDDATRYIARVFKTFLSMDEEEKELLNNDFFNRKESGWWTRRYTKEEYEQLFFNTIYIFLRRFKEYAY